MDVLNSCIRWAGPEGLITTRAGDGSPGVLGNDGPANAAALNYPQAVAAGPDGTLYVVENGGGSRLRRLEQTPLPGFAYTDIVLAADDGSELYVFDKAGRHLRTLDALTGTLRYQFAYTPTGYLQEVTDAYHNTTTIERNATGSPTAIVSPYGQPTTLELGANGYLASLTNPANETTAFTYTPEGLMLTMTRPWDPGSPFRFAYDDRGRLLRDDDPAGGF